ncbi:hypothetical protein [Rubellimicrobium roseum]|uniref:Uncharacterized protein n=1 Tax=Rubellimicrobium roseum TaxID=687525 RepID=A0A5C4NM80_9RHOB|nr:hypothetical protein [Rubellimicrobium roseum]TNC73807.1 hypothetical protein FHG71_04860 [Rubellimicrobium roseum]
MGHGARLLLGLLAPVLGAVLGGGLGILGGFAWTGLAGTSSFEGYSGHPIAVWMLVGALIGLIVAPVVLFRWIRRRDRRGGP